MPGLMPRCLATRSAQALSMLNRAVRVSITLAASNASNRADLSIAHLADRAAAVDFARLVPPRRQAEMRADVFGMLEASGIIDRRLERQRDNRADPGHRHQSPADVVRPHDQQHLTMHAGRGWRRRPRRD